MKVFLTSFSSKLIYRMFDTYWCNSILSKFALFYIAQGMHKTSH